MKLQFTYNQYLKSIAAIVLLSVLVGCNLIQGSQQKNDPALPRAQNPQDSNSGSGGNSGQDSNSGSDNGSSNDSGSNSGHNPGDNTGGNPGQNPNPGDGSSGGGQIDFIFLQKNLFQVRCQQCHARRDQFQFLDKAVVVSKIEEIKERAIIQKDMPPRQPLNDPEIAMLQIWINNGMP